MMSEEEEAWPEVGELVVARVTRIEDYGAYVYLEEYDKEGLVHISELSPTWVRRVEDVVQEGQRLVLKVLRVNKKRGHIDLSLKRVSKKEQQEKLQSWKREKTAITVIARAAEKLKVDEEELSDAILSAFNSLYQGLEVLLRNPSRFTRKGKLDPKVVEGLRAIARHYIKLPEAKIKGYFVMRSFEPNGVDIIKEAFKKALKAKLPKEVSLKIYADGAPKYALEITASDYKRAEKALQIVVSTVERAMKGKGTVSFQRLKHA